jgi:hypothetical protein
MSRENKEEKKNTNKTKGKTTLKFFPRRFSCCGRLGTGEMGVTAGLSSTRRGADEECKKLLFFSPDILHRSCLPWRWYTRGERIPKEENTNCGKEIKLREKKIKDPSFTNAFDPSFEMNTAVEPLFITYSIGQKCLYLLRKVLKSRYGFP